MDEENNNPTYTDEEENYSPQGNQENDTYVYEICQLFDKDNDESIYMKDIIELIKALGIPLNSRTQQIVGDFMEKTKTEKIKFEVFFNLFDTLNENKKTKAEEEQELLKAFEFFDLEKTGFIDANYFKKAVISFGNRISEQDYNTLMQQAMFDKKNKNFDYKDLIQIILGNKD